MRPKTSTWIRHIALLLLTLLTCTVAALLPPFGGHVELGAGVDPQTFSELLQLIPSIPFAYGGLIGSALITLFTDASALAYGLKFSFSLLFILVCHEMGHYIACRIYGVDATLPYFIPTPPLIGPAGTLGAFIRIVSPMPTRKAVFDIGVAGPLAGFAALIPVSILMIYTLEPAPAVPGLTADIIFSDPLWIQGLALLKGIDLSQPVTANPFYAATWLGLLVTALNLIPSGQLDGGHAVFAVLGERLHRLTGRVAFFVMATLSIFGMYFYQSPAGFLFAVVLGVMMKIRHPEPLYPGKLDKKRIAIAILTLLVFILCFVPFPIQLP